MHFEGKEMKHTREVLVELRTLLPEKWKVRKEGSGIRPFRILDSYDGAILSSGAALLEFREESGKIELLPEKIEERLEKPLPREPFKTVSMQCCELRNIVEKIVGEWLLGTRAQGIERVERYRIENNDEKGVAHVLLRTLECEGGTPVTVVVVQPYRGYVREVSSVRNGLEARYPIAAAPPLLHRSLPDSIRSLSEPLPKVWPTEGSRAAVVDLGRHILNRIRHLEPGVIEDTDPEVLHQYRVALRRMRSLVTLLKEAFLAAEQETIRTRLKSAMQGTNRLRDLDVQIAEVAALSSSLPDMLQPGFDRLLLRLHEERKLEFESVRNILVAARFEERFEPVYTALDGNAEPVPETISVLLAPAIAKRYHWIEQEIPTLEEDIKPERLHGLRVSCKKLRYLMEFFPPLLCRDHAIPFLKDLKNLQTLLGSYNDLCVLEGFLLNQTKQHKKNSAALMAIGAIIMQKYEKRNRLAQQCIAAARDFCSTAHKRSVRDILRGETV